MFTRVPTYANYMNLTNNALDTKAAVNHYSYQSTSGLKHEDYAGYGSDTSTILDVESALMVNSQFQQNNQIKQIELNAMENAMESINDVVSNLESTLNELATMDLEDTSPDYTGGELTFESDNFNDYVGETITINGTTYTFTDNSDAGNNIDISDQTDAEGILNDLKAKIDASGDENASEYKYDGNKMEFPIHTVDEPSTLLNNSDIKTGDTYYPENEIILQKEELQSQAFSSMTQLADLLNTNVNGKYVFGGENQSEKPIDFPYTTLEEFQEVYDGKTITFPTNEAALKADINLDNGNLGNLEFETSATNNEVGIIRSDVTGGFLTPEVTASANTTGDITFNAANNTMKAQNNDSFSNLEPGDIISVGGNDAGANERYYIVKEVSQDGKTVTFDDSTAVAADLGPIANGGNIEVSSSFPKDTVISLDGVGNDVPQEVQVIGINNDGTELLVKIADGDFPANGSPKTVANTVEYNIHTDPLTRSTDSSNEHRVNENQVIANNVDAADEAFMDLFLAIGGIAQNNLFYDANPADGESLDTEHTREFVSNAQSTLDGAMAQFSQEQAKVISDLNVINTTLENQKAMETELTNTLVDVKKADSDEAALNLLMAQNQLKISYSVISSMKDISLVNYL